MTLSLTIFIILALLLALMLIGRCVELKTSKYLLSRKIRTAGDKHIRIILLAVFRNVVKIKKLVYREMYLLPRRFYKLSHFLWSKTKEKVDKFYDRVHK